MKKFKRTNKKKRTILISGIVSVFCMTIIALYHSYAIYEEKQELNVIKGTVPNQEYDLKLSYTITDKDGQIKPTNDIPKGKNYEVTISCNNNATGKWNYENWGPDIRNLNTTRTKCNIDFKKSKPLEKYGMIEYLAENNSGIYQVPHENAVITYTDDLNAIKNLQQMEYRYAGPNPNNYLKFNNELWRIIGLVNTIEGRRIKIVRNESLGKYAWDTSETNINGGYGINEWSESKIKKLLNEGPYYNRSSGTCFVGYNNVTEPCDFSNSGMTESAKNLIDNVTWNTAAILTEGQNISNNTLELYNYERGFRVGRNCTLGMYCNDTVERKTTWIGKIGLIYPSDYGYATSGGSKQRATCLETPLSNWNQEELSDCQENNWLLSKEKAKYTMTKKKKNSNYIIALSIKGNAFPNSSSTAVMDALLIYPSLYLKENVKMINGQGTLKEPYEITLE